MSTLQMIKKRWSERPRRFSGGRAVLCNTYFDSRISAVKRGVERAGATALVYHKDLSKESCSDVEVEEWIRKRGSGEEERVLIVL